MFQMWRQRNTYKAQVSALNVKIKAREKAILEEMERRNLKGIESKSGERLTYVKGTTVVYDKDKLKAKLLKSKKGRAILARCTVEVIDMQAIAAEVQAGNIPPQIIAECSETKDTAPYLRGGGKGE
jgi:hypothetical protein